MARRGGESSRRDSILGILSPHSREKSSNSRPPVTSERIQIQLESRSFAMWRNAGRNGRRRQRRHTDKRTPRLMRDDEIDVHGEQHFPETITLGNDPGGVVRRRSSGRSWRRVNGVTMARACSDYGRRKYSSRARMTRGERVPRDS